MRKLATCVALVAALALPATASAGQKIKLKGEVSGAPESKVKVGVKKQKGEIKKITAIRFRKVPVTCSDNSSGTIKVNLPQFRVRDKDFTRKAKIRGRGIDNGIIRVKGKFRRGGKVLKGSVRLSFKAESGAGCGTDKRDFKAQKEPGRGGSGDGGSGGGGSGGGD